MLLNASLTVRPGAAKSHARCGWQGFTDRLLHRLSGTHAGIVFVLWGNDAQRKARQIQGRRNKLLLGTHPSPLAAHRGFFGSRPFSQVDQLLSELGREPIDWRLP